ncbi:hypothetical protein BJY04DRAFT_183609 [Aspergillus karnatakaensis]|uniref:uncharacterized protein n=1 Tax=Aspergillus karnatakaensis TaxID=1810916 RepID=UPI003CCCFB69
MSSINSLSQVYQFGEGPEHLILPQEIVDIINEYVVEGRPDDVHFSGSVSKQLCLVNRYWNRVFTPKLYARFEFPGDINKLDSLWFFLRTLVQRPDLAALVRDLTFTAIHRRTRLETKKMMKPFRTAWYSSSDLQEYVHGELQYYVQDKLPSELLSYDADMILPYFRELPDDDWMNYYLGEVVNGFYTEDLYEIHKSWFPEILLRSVFLDLHSSAQGYLARPYVRDNYLTPLIALAVALSPNLANLSCASPISMADPLFQRILNIALKQSPCPTALEGRLPMDKLKVIRARDAPYDPEESPIPELNIRDYWGLPNTRDLTFVNLEIGGGLARRWSCCR